MNPIQYVFLVSWNLLFSSNYGQTWEQHFRKFYFENETQAEDFIKSAPKDRFECTESFWNQHGICEAKDLKIEKVEKEKAKRDMDRAPR